MEKSNEKTYSRYRPARRALLFWTIFIGIGAVAGSSAMLIDPSGGLMGMDAMLPYFQKLPFAEIVFQDFVFSGISLLIVNGISNLTAAGLLIANKRIGAVLGGVFGITLMLWICIQFYMFPLNFMSTIYFIFGICQAAAGYAAWVFALAAPVRSFCKAAAGQIREADYILVHHQKDTYENAAEEMDRLLGVTHTSLRSIQCREGTYKGTSKRK